jgi:hypothetical protein
MLGKHSPLRDRMLQSNRSDILAHSVAGHSFAFPSPRTSVMLVRILLDLVLNSNLQETLRSRRAIESRVDPR